MIVREDDLLSGYIFQTLGFLFYTSDRVISPSQCFKQPKSGRQLQFRVIRKCPLLTVMLYCVKARENILGVLWLLSYMS